MDDSVLHRDKINMSQQLVGDGMVLNINASTYDLVEQGQEARHFQTVECLPFPYVLTIEELKAMFKKRVEQANANAGNPIKRSKTELN